MPELASAADEGRLMEMLACGTAAIVSPIGGVHYGDRMIQIPTPGDGLAQRWVLFSKTSLDSRDVIIPHWTQLRSWIFSIFSSPMGVIPIPTHLDA